MSDLKYATVPLTDLVTYPANPRQGDIDTIAESLQVNGQYRPIVVQKSTSQILAGNHTYLAAKGLDWATIDVVFVDVDDDQAKRIVLADNRTADLGEYDDDILAALLVDLPDLEGTGYTPDDLDELLLGLRGSEDLEDIDEHSDEGDGGKSIVLEFEARTYDWIVKKLDVLADRFGVETHTETVLKLVADAAGVKAPRYRK